MGRSINEIREELARYSRKGDDEQALVRELDDAIAEAGASLVPIDLVASDLIIPTEAGALPDSGTVFTPYMLNSQTEVPPAQSAE